MAKFRHESVILLLSSSQIGSSLKLAAVYLRVYGLRGHVAGRACLMAIWWVVKLPSLVAVLDLMRKLVTASTLDGPVPRRSGPLCLLDSDSSCTRLLGVIMGVGQDVNI